MKKCVQLLTVLLFVASLAAGYAFAQNLDNFKVYKCNAWGFDPPYPVVALHDQFDLAGEVDSVMLDEIDYFANPVSLNLQGILDPLAHHVWYHFVPLLQDQTRYWVKVQNQFVENELVLGPAQYLLVPANKNDEGFPENLDHYKAYPVISGYGIGQNVNLVDQFLDEDELVLYPKWFCNPVDKNGEGIINDVDHLVFYELYYMTELNQLITAQDQFGYYDILIEQSYWLGVPSLKLEWSTWPTEVELGNFEATKYSDRIEVVWTTASEISTGGFNIHRSLTEDGPYARVNDRLIPTRGTELEGASYSFVDRDVVYFLDYYYRLESVDLSGKGTMHGPVFVTGSAEESRAPAAFGLSQNYPNPFNPVTEIRYDLPVDCQVSLVVYNALGQKVATLVNEFQRAGSRVASWDARSDNGMRVSSGVYFYKLRAGTFVETRKMALLK